MLTNSYFTAELGRELQGEKRARAEGQRLGQQFQAQSRPSPGPPSGLGGSFAVPCALSSPDLS
jgi:hypothetical protein